jgi:diaminopimelate decarboxylase
MMNPEVVYYPRPEILDVASRFETPFFIYEEKQLRKNCSYFRDSFTKYFPDFVPLYAIKANSNPDLVRIIQSEGFGADCSAESEAWLCDKLGMSGMYTGNYTSEREFAFVLGKDMILNLDDASMVDTVARLGMPETLSFRVNPGRGNSTLENNLVAGPNAKFGVPFEQASEAYSLVRERGVKHFGIHMMTGSNVPLAEQDYFADIVQQLFEIVADIKRNTGIEIEFMNIGGGFGVPYKPEEPDIDLDYIARSVRAVVDRQCEKYGLIEPRLYAEPGRFITANAGWLVGRVTVIKDSYKKFVGIDASTNDMPRTANYGVYHHISVIGDSSDEEEVAVVGRLCENNDHFSKGIVLPKCSVGDPVVIHHSGGHGRAMAHNYNGALRHAEYLIRETGEISLIRESEKIEDLFIHTHI